MPIGMGGEAPMPPGGPPGGGGQGGIGPVTKPEVHGGSVQSAMSKLQIGVRAMQESLPSLPMGSELHEAVLKALTAISKHMASSGMGGDRNGEIQKLAEMAAQRQREPGQMDQMAKLLGGPMPPGGAGPAEGGMPEPPQGGEAAPPG